MMKKVLFVLKRKEDYNVDRDSYHIGLSTGLYNSASFVNQMLVDHGVESNLVVVTDNNDIDREVTKYRPDVVIIEALWVVPEKFAILSKLHPTVTWLIRIHSEMPFMAGEGNAMKWIGEYSAHHNIVLGINAPRMLDEIRFYLKLKNQWTDEYTNQRVVYLPNYYPETIQPKSLNKKRDVVDIGCFGAIRPLKNQLEQAVAAVKFADRIGKKLRFHINASRLEMQGGPVLHNMIGLFDQLINTGHTLVRHEWMPHEDFLALCATMDLGMQCSFSETFNIVGADLVSQGVPLIASSEIPWIRMGAANPTDSNDMARALSFAYSFPKLNVVRNQYELRKYSKKTIHTWLKHFR